MQFREYVNLCMWTEQVIENISNGETTYLFSEVIDSPTHRITDSFRQIWHGHTIPKNVKEQARKAFEKMLINPASVDFKKYTYADTYSAKISLGWRALAAKKNGIYYWFWIGPREFLNNKTAKDYAPPFIDATTLPPMRHPNRLLPKPLHI